MILFISYISIYSSHAQQFSLHGNKEEANSVKEGRWSQRGAKMCTELSLQQPAYQLPSTCSKAARQQASGSLDKHKTSTWKEKASGLLTDCGCHYSNRSGDGCGTSANFCEQGSTTE